MVVVVLERGKMVKVIGLNISSRVVVRAAEVKRLFLLLPTYCNIIMNREGVRGKGYY